ncbi:DUF742 domain-containing protein [Pseudonocardia bannensis]|uniref:DUF742 domain-containing protein n=1 Tax=Pseudonocardia bannensis TaxID=630973 RepID=A0A848DQL7_9PSEU|nr:DUF742 domain-containing protein [Pseudonocardia bannensis]NMH94813.1 DUF742 domain-containing protein [Pseudonocardia bannensis]
MTTGPDDERRHSPEPTFADVMNGFTLDSGRGGKRRRWGRRRGEDVERGPSGGAEPPPSAAPSLPPTGPIDLRAVESASLDPTPVEAASGAAAVRPYAWTRGRTKSGLDLAIETLVSTSTQGRNQLGLLQVEHRAVAELCEQTRSVAEVAALLSLPLGVARVLLGDMAGLGVVVVHQTASSAGSLPDLALMERVLSGLRRL